MSMQTTQVLKRFSILSVSSVAVFGCAICG